MIAPRLATSSVDSRPHDGASAPRDGLGEYPGFNVVARNQDDHVKNIAFLMDRRGTWSLAPAFDVTWSYNPSGSWTHEHQMSLNGKRNGFVRTDLDAVARVAGLKRGASKRIVDEVVEAVRAWPALAADSGVPELRWRRIAKTHRLDW